MSQKSSGPTMRRLPQQPNLEQLRKQAKDLLENYRSGIPAAIEEVRQFEWNAVPEKFALSDAQRVLARAYGFASWPKLQAYVDGVNVASFAAAVKAGEMARVRSMLSSRPELINMDMAESDERRALHFAVLARNAAMVRLLMEAGADARKGVYPHRDATSALTLARDRDYTDIVAAIEDEERLRREEMSCPNATVSPVQDQISAAISACDTATAMTLLESDLSLIQACDRNGATPLHVSAQAANLELVRWLLDRRAPVRKKDMRELTALDRAALAADPRNHKAQHFPAIARALLDHGAELTLYAAVALGDVFRVREMIRKEPVLLRVTAPSGLLTVAVNHSQTEMVRLLLDLGADVDERTMLDQVEEPTLSWGMPLWSAALANNLEISRLLLDRGADPNANVYASGWPLLNAWSHEDESVKRLLLERGAKAHPYMVAKAQDIAEAKHLLGSALSEEVANELAWAAGDFGFPEIVKLALPHLTWPKDDPQWHWVLIQPTRGAGADADPFLACLRAILDYGVSPNVARLGHTTLHYAASRHSSLLDADRARFASLLIDYGARLDLRDDLLLSTPLGWACRWGHLEMARTLIARGASVVEPDAESWATPMAWAKKMGHPEIVELLLAAS
jgi:ankyrin repeat protein